jgi:Mg2+/Co2+ transporter CorB
VSLLPVSLHRLLFRRRLKSSTVAIGDAMVRVVTIGVFLTMIGTAMLIFDFVAGRTAGIVAAGALAAVIVLFGLVLPLVVRRVTEPGKDSQA